MTMKKLNVLGLAVAAFFLLALPAFARDSAAAEQPGTGFNQWDFLTYPGLIAAVVAIIGAVKKLFPAWAVGKEPYLGLAFSYVLGVIAKLTIPGAFDKVHWIVFLVTLLFVALGAKLSHDHLLNEVIKGQSPEKKLDEKVEEKVSEKIAQIKKP
jgi:hypothetical protein